MSNSSQLYTFLKEDIILVVVNCFPDRKLIWEIIKNGVFLFVSLYFSGSGKRLMSTRCLCPVVVVQLPSHVQLFVTPWTTASQAALSLTISRSLSKFMFISLVMPSICCPLLLPSTFPSISDFSNKSSVCIRWPKYWSFSFSISPSSEHSGWISLRTDCQDELPQARGQGRWPRGATPYPRSGGCVGTEGPRGATPRSRSGGAVVRRYPSSKVRSSSCTLLEQPWRDTPRPR